ncbi:hypothetical protein EVAR_50497_1 [Eumeta japonica]|uniref:Uncharacterized protein n=1 Tax=Eumeta variegata TaxID=151549 RepID=A0A4C2A338_EUMVA|nr:hypothetical protein EVAR_50497_1 [Eumeta japonica]
MCVEFYSKIKKRCDHKKIHFERSNEGVLCWPIGKDDLKTIDKKISGINARNGRERERTQFTREALKVDNNRRKNEAPPRSSDSLPPSIGQIDKHQSAGLFHRGPFHSRWRRERMQFIRMYAER